jgi:RNA polymerase sigma-70 factor (TIGR02943 family)
MTRQQPPGQRIRADPANWVEKHGDYLFRYSLSRLRQPEEAEDLVQETFLSALRAQEQFAGHSSERTWLFCILKRKIVDRLRRKGRERPVSDFAAADQWADNLFDERGHWKRGPGEWGDDPISTFEKKEFWSVFSRCLGKLPQRLADDFTLREVEDLEGREVCKALDVSASNLWVMLHRARLRLWRCLELNWFRANK